MDTERIQIQATVQGYDMGKRGAFRGLRLTDVRDLKSGVLLIDNLTLPKGKWTHNLQPGATVMLKGRKTANKAASLVRFIDSQGQDWTLKYLRIDGANAQTPAQTQTQRGA
jgi:hypothetical protein